MATPIPHTSAASATTRIPRSDTSGQNSRRGGCFTVTVVPPLTDRFSHCRPVTRLAYTPDHRGLWAGCALLGEIALDHTTSVQATIVFGVTTAIVPAPC